MAVGFDGPALALFGAVLLVFLAIRRALRRRKRRPPLSAAPETRGWRRGKRGSFPEIPKARWRINSSRPGRAKPVRNDVFTGNAWVTDGDGVRVNGEVVRLAGLDAPEWDQIARNRNGEWFNHGAVVKKALIRALGGQGQEVVVRVEGRDRYGRLLGTVSCRGRDIGQWMVRYGLAVAAFDERYREFEIQAQHEGCGMWGYEISFDPRYWRARSERPGIGCDTSEGGEALAGELVIREDAWRRRRARESALPE